MDEKSEIMTDAKAKSSLADTTNQTARDLDEAFWYVRNSSTRHDAFAASASDLKALRRKIDWHVVPIMFCCYTMQFIDKVLLNVSQPVTCCPVSIV